MTLPLVLPLVRNHPTNMTVMPQYAPSCLWSPFDPAPSYPVTSSPQSRRHNISTPRSMDPFEGYTYPPTSLHQNTADNGIYSYPTQPQHVHHPSQDVPRHHYGTEAAIEDPNFYWPEHQSSPQVPNRDQQVNHHYQHSSSSSINSNFEVVPWTDAHTTATQPSSAVTHTYSPYTSSSSGSPGFPVAYSTIQLSPNMYRPRSVEQTPFGATSQQQLSPSASPHFPTGVVASEHHTPSNPDAHREQLKLFRDALSLPMAGLVGPFVPQRMYIPHTNSDRRRYVEEIDLQGPIYFWMQDPEECGIPLVDALHSRVRRLLNRDEPVFEGRGPSISVRIQWPGYRPWSRQIPTKDFRSPPGPITRAKLAKNVAKCVDRFLQARSTQPLEDDADPRWRVGSRPNEIKLDDLILVSMHHVSMGSWQPHLRLRRPFPSQASQISQA